MKLGYLYPNKKLDDFVGERHLIGKDGIFSKMLKSDKFISTILYGPPGSGKTSIVKALFEQSGKKYYFLDATNISKKDIVDILNTDSKYIYLIIDEFHRLTKDRQDLLLEMLDSGRLILFGLTTENPYMVVNKAIRSRMIIKKTNSLSDDDLKNVLLNMIKKIDDGIKIDDEALKVLSSNSNGEARVVLNYLEEALLYIEKDKKITLEIAKNIIGDKRFSMGSVDDYYNLLSALQKSIRGSDVDASIYYLSRLINMGDLKSIARRLLVIAYEDISLANGGLIQKTHMAINSALEVGFPEARIILAYITIELAISPKSNSAYLAIEKALSEKDYEIPNFLNNQLLKIGKYNYKYPHDYKNALTDDNYLPEKIKDKIFYNPKDNSNYEKIIKERLSEIDKIKRKVR